MGPFGPGHTGMATAGEDQGHLPTAPILQMWKPRPRGDLGLDGFDIHELGVTPGVRGVDHALQGPWELTLKIRLEVPLTLKAVEAQDLPSGP